MEFLYVGKAYQRQGRAAEARTAFEKILKIAPGHAEARRRLDSPYQPELDEPSGTEAVGMTVADVVQGEMVEGGIELSLPESTLLTPLQPAPEAEGAPATLPEARSLLARGNLAKAERMVRALLLEDADQLEYQAILGLVYLKKGQIAAAYDTLYRIAQAWHAQDRCDEASELIDAYLMAEPDDSDFLQLKVRVTQEPAAATAETPDLPVIPAGGGKAGFLAVEPAAAPAEKGLSPAGARGAAPGVPAHG